MNKEELKELKQRAEKFVEDGRDERNFELRWKSFLEEAPEEVRKSLDNKALKMLCSLWFDKGRTFEGTRLGLEMNKFIGEMIMEKMKNGKQ